MNWTDLPSDNIIICGHFGCGKTNLSVGIALGLASAGLPVGIVDLDIVNPYFRTADSVPVLKAAGIDCFIPQFANTNVDIPSLGGEISSVFAKQETIPEYKAIFDVGGDNGAVALGRYRAEFTRLGYSLIFVMSKYRPLTSTPEETIADLREIEECSGLRATAIVNNSNIGRETTADYIAGSLDYAREVERLSSLRLLTTTLHSAKIAEELRSAYPGFDFTVIPDSTKKLF